MTAPIWVPTLAMLVLLVGLDSGRPLLFRQKRMGREQQAFRVLKLRTMRVGAPAPGTALFAGWTYPGDPRVTRVGRWLRRYRLDELPQLVNVLAGDMSLIGPRPEPWEVAMQLGREIPGYHDRHHVRPGLTGLCQVSPDYYDFGTVERSRAKLAHDLEYVRTRSVGLDLRILARTLGVVLRGTGIA